MADSCYNFALLKGVAHEADFVTVLLVGKPDGNWSGPTPAGTVHVDDATLLFAAYAELWVAVGGGDDGNEGTTSDAPLATLWRARRGRMAANLPSAFQPMR